MTDIEDKTLTIGTISVLRSLVELRRVKVIDLPVDDFVLKQRESGDPDQLAEAIETIRGHISVSANTVK
jgi:hypothetical protein